MDAASSRSSLRLHRVRRFPRIAAVGVAAALWC